jgi:hypothetical protein
MFLSDEREFQDHFGNLFLKIVSDPKFEERVLSKLPQRIPNQIKFKRYYMTVIDYYYHKDPIRYIQEFGNWIYVDHQWTTTVLETRYLNWKIIVKKGFCVSQIASDQRIVTTFNAFSRTGFLDDIANEMGTIYFPLVFKLSDLTIPCLYTLFKNDVFEVKEIRHVSKLNDYREKDFSR